MAQAVFQILLAHMVSIILTFEIVWKFSRHLPMPFQCILRIWMVQHLWSRGQTNIEMHRHISIQLGPSLEIHSGPAHGQLFGTKRFFHGGHCINFSMTPSTHHHSQAWKTVSHLSYCLWYNWVINGSGEAILPLITLGKIVGHAKLQPERF